MATRTTSGGDDPPPSLTPFKSRVYEAVRAIPRGAVRTYGSIASEMHTSARAVGTAMGGASGHDVPWHRVVASDRSLGGFGHEWGDDLPKVRTKRRLLEAEGVRFEEGGDRAKIRTEFFAASPHTDAGKRAKWRKTEDTAVVAQGSPKTKTTAENVATVDEETLKRETLDLLRKRHPKTCWPSEIPRGLVRRGMTTAAWRDLMAPTREAGRILARAGHIEVVQKGRVLGTKEAYRGPVRFRLRSE